ncbi:MAG: hypothetical protein E7270_05170 [Lachnospiraceae bacterium]|nr:hypothetical protein [Lachnospiraceae bacterium]
MENQDTIHLLKECDAGTKMAISSIDDILEKVKDEKLKNILSKSKEEHTKIEDEIKVLLNEYDSDEKEPNAMAKGMSWLKTNFKMSMDESDATVADLITDGCNMGVKSLNEYFNKYEAANSKVKDICTRLIKLEEQLCKDIKGYL